MAAADGLVANDFIVRGSKREPEGVQEGIPRCCFVAGPAHPAERGSGSAARKVDIAAGVHVVDEHVIIWDYPPCQENPLKAQ